MIYCYGTAATVVLTYIAYHLKSSRDYYYRHYSVRLPTSLYRLLAILSALPLTIISAVRYNVGTDFLAYYQMYLLGGLKKSRSVEKGFTMFVQFLNKFSSEPQTFFIVSSVMICFLYFFYIYKESDNPIFSIILFVLTKEYFRAMNGVRQYMALVVLLFMIPYIREKKCLRCVPLFLIGLMFHSSAIIFILFAVLYYLNLRPKVTAAITAGMIVFSSIIKGILSPLINKYTSFGFYLQNSSEYNFETLTFLMFVAFYLLAVYVEKTEKVPIEGKLRLFYNGVFLGMIFFALTIAFPSVINRFGWYGNAFITVYAPSAINQIRGRAKRNFLYISIFVLYLLITIPQLLRGNQSVLPYMTYWQ